MTTLEVKHPFTNEKPDGGDTTIARPSDWNANHPIIMSPGVIGRTTSGVGLATVLPIGSGASGDVILSSQVRQNLTSAPAGREIHVRYNLGTCIMSIASPAVVTLGAPHNLSAGDRVVFSLPYDDNVTTSITIATPGVITTGLPVTHDYANNDPIMLRSSGSLPTGLTPETLLFVRNPTSSTFEVSLTSGGASLATSGSQVGHCKIERWSLLPTGVIEGKPYFVIATGLSSTQFQFSETLGGAAVNTSGSQRGKITLQTGNDANVGYPAGQATALLTPQEAWERTCQVDTRDYTVSIYLADSKYYVEDDSVINIFRAGAGRDPNDGGWTPQGGGGVFFQGANENRGNVVLKSTNAAPVSIYGNYDCPLRWLSMTFESEGGYQPGLRASFCQNPIYVDSIIYRGTLLSTAVESYVSSVYLHGLHEIIGAVGDYVFKSDNRSNFSYISVGGGYFTGVIAYGQKNPFAILKASDLSSMFIAAACEWEGDYTGLWGYTEMGGVIETYGSGYANPSPVWMMGTGRENRGGAFHERNFTTGYWLTDASCDFMWVNPRTVAELPAAGVMGRKAYVTDANATTFNSVVAGGGSNKLGVQDDGTDWRIG